MSLCWAGLAHQGENCLEEYLRHSLGEEALELEAAQQRCWLQAGAYVLQRRYLE